MIGLTMATKRHDIVKGILDSLTYEMKINIEVMKESGININELRCVGGAAKSPFWMQIKADITGCVVNTLKVREAACLGAAILAGSAAGGYVSLDEGVNATVEVAETFTPDEKNGLCYNEKYTVYKEIYKALKRINEQLG
jgi:xylulokinase